MRSANTCSIWSRCPRAKLLVSTDIRAAIQDEAPPTDGTNVGAVSKLGGYDAPQLLLCETRRSEEHLQSPNVEVSKAHGSKAERELRQLEGALGLQTFGLTCSDVRLRMMLMPHTASASSVLCKTDGTAAVSWASRACDMRLVCVGGRCWQHTRARRLDERDAWRATRRPTMHIARNSSARKGRAPIPCENVVRSHVVRPPIMKFPENLDIRRDRHNAQPTPPLRCHHGVSRGQGCALSKLRAK